MKPIVVDNVSKVFRSDWMFRPKTALDGISFEVDAGECFGFIGPNGAGKTTMIKVLLDIVRPTRGKVLLCGESPSRANARRRVGYMPERPYFYEHLTGEEILRFYGQLSGLREVPVAAMLETLGLSDAAKTRLAKYSKGMLQRIGIGAALIGDPDVVILDEPMSGLDPPGRREVRDIILDLKARKKTVFFSTHILPDVEAICDRVAMVHKGKLVMQGNVNDLRGQLEARFLKEIHA